MTRPYTAGLPPDMAPINDPTRAALRVDAARLARAVAALPLTTVCMMPAATRELVMNLREAAKITAERIETMEE